MSIIVNNFDEKEGSDWVCSTIHDPSHIYVKETFLSSNDLFVKEFLFTTSLWFLLRGNFLSNRWPHLVFPDRKNWVCITTVVHINFSMITITVGDLNRRLTTTPNQFDNFTDLSWPGSPPSVSRLTFVEFPLVKRDRDRHQWYVSVFYLEIEWNFCGYFLSSFNEKVEITGERKVTII